MVEPQGSGSRQMKHEFKRGKEARESVEPTTTALFQVKNPELGICALKPFIFKRFQLRHLESVGLSSMSAKPNRINAF